MVASSDIEPTSAFQVGDWTVDPDSGRLHKADAEVKLEPKVMEVLVFLAKHPSMVVSREALEARAWAGMVVGYDAVSGSIIKLRKALGDDSRHPQYIETISKKGYRLIAPVSPVTGEAQSPVTPDSAVTAQPLVAKIKINRLVAAGLGFVAVIGVLFFLINAPNATNQTIKSPSKKPSVLVLPFKNLSDDPGQEYLSDGVTDDLITDLSMMESIRVIARQSSDYYKQHSANLGDIAQQLGVLYIVEGSVRKSGKRIRINVQLTNTKLHENIWAERFDIDDNDIFKVQDSITQEVMHAMVGGLASHRPDTAESRGTKNFQAYDAFLIGQRYIKTRSKQGYDQSMKAFRRAIEIDPDYARAYGAMAVTLTRGYRYHWSDLSLDEARERALELANRAVELGKPTPQIYWALGYVHLHRREYDAAEKAAKQSIMLSPNYADGYALLANIVNWRGKAMDAENYIKKAMALNPYYTFQYPSTLGLAYYNLGRYEDATAILSDALIRNENALNPRLFLAATYVRLKLREEATWEVEQVRANRPEVTLSSLDTILPFESKIYMNVLRADLRKAGLPE